MQELGQWVPCKQQWESAKARGEAPRKLDVGPASQSGDPRLGTSKLQAGADTGGRDESGGRTHQGIRRGRRAESLFSGKEELSWNYFNRNNETAVVEPAGRCVERDGEWGVRTEWKSELPQNSGAILRWRSRRRDGLFIIIIAIQVTTEHWVVPWAVPISMCPLVIYLIHSINSVCVKRTQHW